MRHADEIGKTLHMYPVLAKANSKNREERKLLDHPSVTHGIGSATARRAAALESSLTTFRR